LLPRVVMSALSVDRSMFTSCAVLISRTPAAVAAAVLNSALVFAPPATGVAL
jgi:hypothetical protein